MNTSEIRQELIEKIKNSLPDNIVMDIARLVKIDGHETYVFTEQERKLVYEAIKGYEEGNFLSGKVAEDDIQQWLKD